MQSITENSRPTYEYSIAQSDVTVMSKLRELNESLITQVSQSLISLEAMRDTNCVLTRDKESMVAVHEIQRMKFIAGEDKMKTDFEASSVDLCRRLALLEERGMMGFEDKVATDSRFNLFVIQMTQSEMHHGSEITDLRNYVGELLRLSADKDKELFAVNQTVHDSREKHKYERSDMSLKLSETTEISALLRMQNDELEKDVSTLYEKLKTSIIDAQTQAVEKSQIMSSMDRMEALKVNIEAEKSVLLSRIDFFVSQSETASLRTKALEMQLVEAHDQLVEASSRESQINESTVTASEKYSEIIYQMEEQIILNQNTAKETINSSVQMAAMLRAELEIRVNELTSVMSQRKELEEERLSHLSKIEELQMLVKSNDATFRSVLESDRSRMQEEIKRRNAKMGILDAEKQELLRETHDLSIQHIANQRDISSLKGELMTFSDRLAESHSQEECSRRKQSEQLDELRSTARREEELKEEIIRIQAHVKGEDGRLEHVLKEVKKVAAQQIMALSVQLRTIHEEHDKIKSQLIDSCEIEKRAIIEVEKSRKDIDSIIKLREDMQLQCSVESSALRKELQEQRIKVKNITEAKTSVDLELLNSRNILQKADAELGSIKEKYNSLQTKLNNSNMDIESLNRIAKDESLSAKTRYDELFTKVLYLETYVEKQKSEMQIVAQECSKADKNSKKEFREMASRLDISVQELLEFQPIVSALRAECSDQKNRLSELQESSHEAVTILNGELKSTENALSAERKKSQQDVDGYRMQIVELQDMLQRAKENIEEGVSKSRADKADKDLRSRQSEGEMERFQAMLMSKDLRLEALEKQHQEDRSRILALNTRLEVAERAGIDLQAAGVLEKEITVRLEKRLIYVSNELNNRIHGSGSSPRNSKSMGSLSDTIVSARNEVIRHSLTDTQHHESYTVDVTANNRILKHGEQQQYKTMPNRGVESEVHDPMSDGYLEGEQHKSRQPYGVDRTLGDNDDVTYAPPLAIRDDPLLSSLQLSMSVPLATTAFDNPPLSPPNSSNLIDPKSDPQTQIPGFRQSPIDRVAQALASRAMKDRGVAFATDPIKSKTLMKNLQHTSDPSFSEPVKNQVYLAGRDLNSVGISKVSDDVMHRTEEYLKRKSTVTSGLDRIPAPTDNILQKKEPNYYARLETPVFDDNEDFRLEPPGLNYRAIELNGGYSENPGSAIYPESGNRSARSHQLIQKDIVGPSFRLPDIVILPIKSSKS